MSAFYFRYVEEASSVSDQGTSWKGAFRDRLETAFVEGAGTVGYAFPALDDGRVEGMVLQFLKLAIRAEPWIRIIETNDQTERHEVFAKVVDPATTIGIGGEGIAH